MISKRLDARPKKPDAGSGTRNRLAIAQVQAGDSEHDHSEPEEFITRERLAEEQPRPEHGADVADRNHRIQDREFTMAHAHDEKYRRTQEQHDTKRQTASCRQSSATGNEVESLRLSEKLPRMSR